MSMCPCPLHYQQTARCVCACPDHEVPFVSDEEARRIVAEQLREALPDIPVCDGVKSHDASTCREILAFRGEADYDECPECQGGQS